MMCIFNNYVSAIAPPGLGRPEMFVLSERTMSFVADHCLMSECVRCSYFALSFVQLCLFRAGRAFSGKRVTFLCFDVIIFTFSKLASGINEST